MRVVRTTQDDVTVISLIGESLVLTDTVTAGVRVLSR